VSIQAMFFGMEEWMYGRVEVFVRYVAFPSVTQCPFDDAEMLTKTPS